jgi:hypothetical protein
MNVTKRRIIGGLLAVLAIALVPVLEMANLSPLTMGSAYFVDTGVTRTSVQPHWPLIIPGLTFFLGVLLLAMPRRRTIT